MVFGRFVNFQGSILGEKLKFGKFEVRLSLVQDVRSSDLDKEVGGSVLDFVYR